MESKRSFGTRYLGMAGTGAGGTSDEVMLQVIVNASCCFTAGGK